jgi:hypothetical protein
MRDAAVIVLSSLFVAIVFNANGLYDWALHMKAGAARSFALMLVEPVKTLTASVSLDVPGREIRRTFRGLAGIESDAGYAGSDENPNGWIERAVDRVVRVDVPDDNDALIRGSVFSEARPLKIIFIGDSMVAGAIYGSFIREVFGDKSIRPSLKSRHSSGLTRPDYFDWQREAEAVFSRKQYDCAVVLLGANDAQDMILGGSPYPFNSKKWLETYTSRVASLISYLNGNVPEVYWIGLPRMKKPVYDASMRILNDIYSRACAGFKRIRFIPTAGPLGDTSGNYVDHVVTGNRIEFFRASDGIHLLYPAGRIISALLLDNLHKDFRFKSDGES